MTSSFVVDTSVAMKWLVPEPGSDVACGLRRFRLLAPDLLRVECANVLWRLAATGAMPVDEAFDALSDLAAGPLAYYACDRLEQDALRIALELRHPVYDCYYLALSRQEGVPLVTEDRRLLRAALRHEPFRDLVLALDDVGFRRP